MLARRWPLVRKALLSPDRGRCNPTDQCAGNSSRETRRMRCNRRSRFGHRLKVGAQNPSEFPCGSRFDCKLNAGLSPNYQKGAEIRGWAVAHAIGLGSVLN